MAVTVEEMLAEQNSGFGLDAVTGAGVSWYEGIGNRVANEIMLPYAKLQLGLAGGDATQTRSPTGTYREGKPGTNGESRDWTKYAILAGAILAAVLVLRKVA